MSSASAKPADTGDQYRTAIDAYRTSAKWVVSSFGAVAGALVVGVQLTSLGQLHGWRLFLAIVSVAVAFAAVLVVIRAAVPVLAPVRGNRREFATGPQFAPLREDLIRDDSPLRRKASTAAELVVEYEAAITAQEEAWERHAADPNNVILEQDLLDVEARATGLYDVLITITSLGLFLRTKQLFEKAMRTIYAAILIAAAAAVAFAYLANPSAAQTKPTPLPPPKVQVSVNEPKTCVDLYLALDNLAREKPNIASRWPTHSLGAQDRACGFQNVKELSHFLSYLAHK